MRQRLMNKEKNNNKNDKQLQRYQHRCWNNNKNDRVGS
jgi:hypothetical protein